jgi:tetratricopeptide (TPR) repeat protein
VTETEREDVDALRAAGKESLALDRDDAVDHLTRLTELQPDDAEAWHDLGRALLFQGRLDEAADAFRQAVQLRPDDPGALIDLGHAAHAAHRVDEAIGYLEQAVEHEPTNIGALRSLVEMYRGAGRFEDALATVTQVAELAPDDPLAALDVAELDLALDRLDEAVAAFTRLRRIDDDPEHEVYVYHGMIEAELRRRQWRRALDLAVDATRVDRYGRTTDLLAFVVAQVFGESDRPAPSQDAIDAALQASHAEHRRLHLDAVVV